MVPVWPIEGEPDIHHQGASGRLFHGDHPWGISDCPARDRRRILEYPTMGGAWVLFPVGGSRGFDPRDGGGCESGLSPICADFCSVSMAIDGNMSAISSLNTLAKGEIRSQLILAINVNDVVNGVLFAQKWQAYNKHFRSC